MKKTLCLMVILSILVSPVLVFAVNDGIPGGGNSGGNNAGGNSGGGGNNGTPPGQGGTNPGQGNANSGGNSGGNNAGGNQSGGGTTITNTTSTSLRLIEGFSYDPVEGVLTPQYRN